MFRSLIERIKLWFAPMEEKLRADVERARQRVIAAERKLEQHLRG